MNKHHLQAIVHGNLEVMGQAIHLLSNISDDQYTHVPKPYTSSSIGEHIRHLLDMYYALLQGDHHSALIDYDVRRRGSKVEIDRLAAVAEFNLLIEKLNQLDLAKLDKGVAISSEVMLQKKLAVTMNSTVARELSFVSTHALHHFALIAVLARLQDINIDKHFGIAPATISYMRDIVCAQ